MASKTAAQSFSPTSPGTILLAALPLSCIVLLLVTWLSVAFGAAEINLREVWSALVAFDPQNTNHLIIQTLRVPRALAAALVGAALGVSGAMMQGLTRNPLADPGLLGIQAGATLGVVGGVFLFGAQSLPVYAVFAFVGGALAAFVVYAVGSLGPGRLTPFKLTIAGATLSTMLGALTTTILIFHQRSLEEVRFWLAGSVAGREIALVAQAAPMIVVGLLAAFLLGRQITILSFGEDVARGLGQKVGAIKAITAGIVVVLAGSSVALAGPIGFVGLVIPHVVRMFAGADYRWVLPYSAVLGSLLLVGADLIGRVLVRPHEIPVGIVTAAVGGPIFLYLVCWKVKR